jgi:predicted SprT family Zn-dependent metalloprotease
MTRSLGTISYGEEGPARTVKEIAISADLLVPENRAVLEDTLLHEMAHAEAWLRHGHRGHGPIWRRVAERVGCTPRALIHTRVRRRSRAG